MENPPALKHWRLSGVALQTFLCHPEISRLRRATDALRNIRLRLNEQARVQAASKRLIKSSSPNKPNGTSTARAWSFRHLAGVIYCDGGSRAKRQRAAMKRTETFWHRRYLKFFLLVFFSFFWADGALARRLAARIWKQGKGHNRRHLRNFPPGDQEPSEERCRVCLSFRVGRTSSCDLISCMSVLLPPELQPFWKILHLPQVWQLFPPPEEWLMTVTCTSFYFYSDSPACSPSTLPPPWPGCPRSTGAAGRRRRWPGRRGSDAAACGWPRAARGRARQTPWGGEQRRETFRRVHFTLASFHKSAFILFVSFCRRVASFSLCWRFCDSRHQSYSQYCFH